MSLPKVSVITIAFNAEEYIERTLQNVIAETYPNIEYVVVDGASKDGTLDIIERYKDNIDNFKSEPDKSLYDAMNKGIDRATGDYIMFMNVGDLFASPTSLTDAMQGSNNADFIYSNAIYKPEEGPERPWHKTAPTADKLNAKSFLNGMVICHQCMIVRRSIAPKFDLQWKISADLDWTIRVMKEVKTKHYYNEIFCHYLDGGVSAENRKKAVKERFAICRQHFGTVPTVLEQLRIAWQLVRRGRMS